MNTPHAFRPFPPFSLGAMCRTPSSSSLHDCGLSAGQERRTQTTLQSSQVFYWWQAKGKQGLAALMYFCLPPVVNSQSFSPLHPWLNIVLLRVCLDGLPPFSSWAVVLGLDAVFLMPHPGGLQHLYWWASVCGLHINLLILHCDSSH